MNSIYQTNNKTEGRWSVILFLVVIFGFQHIINNRVIIYPEWFRFIFGGLLFASLIMVNITNGKPFWIKVENIVIIMSFVIVEIAVIKGLYILVYDMIYRPKLESGLMLLLSSIVCWIINILAFALIFWKFDSGGPEERLIKPQYVGELSFPQVGFVRYKWWKPVFMDYFILSVNTSSALGPSDVVPLSLRYKVLMTVEALTSMAIIVIILSRAIGILGY
jgi:hypothetical protein